ncbi:MAG: SigE family RNA polymerase sigma factor [Micromonosporaceae bacterium]|nr:SigE family RNA polymerase sigma factor [Micromonosporaceae bacterium]
MIDCLLWITSGESGRCFHILGSARPCRRGTDPVPPAPKQVKEVPVAQTPAEPAFEEFVAARYPSLVRTGYLLTGDRGHAEDLVQHALAHTYLAWNRLDEVANAEAYTRTVMVRQVVRWRRRWRSEVPTDPLPEPTGTEPTGADHASTVETAQAVRRALARLPAAQRAVLVLRYFDDLSEAQIAEVLGCSPGTVKSRSSRALAALRAAGLLSSAVAQTHEGVRRD